MANRKRADRSAAKGSNQDSRANWLEAIERLIGGGIMVDPADRLAGDSGICLTGGPSASIVRVEIRPGLIAAIG